MLLRKQLNENYFEKIDYVECDEFVYGPKRDSIFIVIPLTIVYLIVFITGTIGNVSTCIVIAKNKHMHTATNYYLFSLAISDLLLLVMGLPQEVYLFWYRYPYIFGNSFCFLRGLFAETSGNATVLTITAFTVERYLAICHPFLSHTISNLSRSLKLIIVIWILSVCLAIPQAMPLKVIGACPFCLAIDPMIEHAFEVSTLVFFVTPMALILVLYILIGLKLESANAINQPYSNSARIQSKSSRQVVKMLVAVVVAFFICWAPFHIQRLYSIYQQPSQEGQSWPLKMYELLTYVSGILYYVSTTINPILYNIMSAKFREAFKITFCRSSCFQVHNNNRPQQSAVSRLNLRERDSLTDFSSHDHTIQTSACNQKNNSCDSFQEGKVKKDKLQLRRSSSQEVEIATRELEQLRIHQN